ncbi:MAG: toxin TcdB middle/N-terminal domain-containing protein [Myxococcota bacterium]
MGPTRISLPTGPGSVEGLGRSFVPSLASGTAAYGIDVAVPPAAGGFAPKLSLDYDGGSGASEVGLGFRISGLPSIRRRTAHGLPKFDATDAFELVGLGMPCDLLPMPDGYYRPQYETGTFARVQRNSDAAKWEVRTKDGTTFRFGGLGFTEEESGNIATYLLREAVDLHGHRIAYTWDTSSGYALLKAVVWNDFSKNVQQRIDLTYEVRPDVHTLFSSGIRRVLAQRVKTIEVTLGGDLVRRYKLGYGAGNRSLLTSVDMFGTDGVTAAPKLTLSYTEPSFATEGQVQRMAFPPYPTPADPNVSLADLNGDGLPDLLVAQAGKFHTYVNHDGITWKPANDWGPSTSPSLSLSSTGVGLADLDGDGAIDLFAKSGTDSFRYFPSKDATRFKASVSIRTVPNFTFEDPDVRLADMDGDRLPDVAITTKAGLAVGYNLGGVDWSLPALVGKIDARQELRFSDGKTELCDVNGDHVQDICYLTPGSLAYWLGRGRGVFELGQQATGVPVFDPTDPWRLVDVNGDGWVDLVHVGVNQIEYALATAEGAYGAVARVKSTPAKGPSATVQFADMNGSGTTDILWVERTQNEGTYWRYLELFPQGRAGLLKTIDNGVGKRTTITYSTAAAYAAAARDAGTPWSSRMNVAMPVVSKVEVDVQLGDPVLTTGYAYANGAWDPGERTFAGFAGGTQTDVGDAYTPTLVTESTFDLGLEHRVLRGAVLTTEQRDASGHVFSRTTSTYRSTTLGEATDGRSIEYAYKNDELVEHVEGADEADVRLTEKSWEQDEFGNVTGEYDWGEVTPEDLSIGNDEAITVRTFANNIEEWVLGRVATEEVTDLTGTRLKMTRHYYDGAAFLGLPLAHVTRGDLSRTESWIEKKRFVDEDRAEYDSDGNTLTILTAQGERREFVYDVSRTYVTRETRSGVGVALSWTSKHDPRFGALLELESPNGARTRFGYDALGRVIDVVKPGDSFALPTVHYDYASGNPLSRQTTSLRNRSGDASAMLTTTLLDGLGRSRGVLRPAENGMSELTGLGRLDARGNTFFAAFPSFEPQAALPTIGKRAGTATRRDALGREIATEHGDGASTSIQYAPLSRTVWDENDTDPKSEHYGTPTRYENDGRGRLVAVVATEAQKEFATRYVYDALGNLLSFQDAAGSVRTYSYDGRSRRIAIDDPNAGVWHFVFGDSDSLERRIDPTENVVRYAYDALGRVIEEWHQKPNEPEALAARYHYDAAAPEHPELGKYIEGNLAWVEDQAGKAFFGYDGRARQTSMLRVWPDGTEHIVHSEFDAADRQVGRRFPDDTALRYEYNARGLLASVGPIVPEIRWNAASNLESLILGNGVVDVRTYDSRLRLQRMSATASNAHVLRDVEYTLDAASRITALTDHRPNVDRTASASATFGFDDRYRLRTVVDAGGKTTTYSYDDVGKILKIETDPVDTALSVENRYGEDGAGPDQLTHHGSESFVYDAAGRLIADGTRKLTWDAKGRLVRVEREGTIEEYAYAFDDARAIKTTSIAAGGTSTVRYLGSDVEVRDGKLVRYVSFGTERVARLDTLDSSTPAAGSTSAGNSTTGKHAGLGTGKWRVIAGSPWTSVAMTVLACLALILAAARTAGVRRPRAFGLVLALACGWTMALGCRAAGEGSNGIEIREAPPGTIYYLGDHQGSPLSIADDSATVVSTATYLPYGAKKSSTGGGVDPHGFVGNELDEGSGLADFHARPYRADAGIFLAPDPLAVFTPEEALTEPNRLYAYAYAGGDPINHADPSGKTFGEYLQGMFDQAKDDVKAAVRAKVQQVQSQGRALAEGRIGDFLRTNVESAIDTLKQPITLAKNVANFGDDFVAAATANSDYEVGRKAVKPVMTAVTLTATVAGLKDVAAGPKPQRCFAGETLVATATGLRVIADIQVGDLVWARDEDSGAEELRPVVRVFVTPDQPLVALRLEQANGSVEVIRATSEHPFWIEGRGWTRAADLGLSAPLATAARTELTVVALGSVAQTATVYNLEVDGLHTYFVGHSGAWVHNTCGTKNPNGTIYLRRNAATGEEYVGQAKPGRFPARQAEHAAKHPGEKFTYDVLEEVKPDSRRSLDVAEEDWIRAGGGPKRAGGLLANDRYQMSDKAYNAAGGTVPKPTE